MINSIYKIMEELREKFSFVDHGERYLLTAEDDEDQIAEFKELEKFFLQSLEQIQKKERAFVGKNKREWYQRGIAEGQKKTRREDLKIVQSLQNEQATYSYDYMNGLIKVEHELNDRLNNPILSQLEKEDKE